ncbi:MAG: CRISPR-associated endonuclease Cas1 [Campylobacterales bacterium]|nr:CRISPR-associated endonuclease Cas1 [Campylobacterales bacterium]
MNTAFITKIDSGFKIENSSLKVNGRNFPLRLLEMIIITDDVVVNSKDMLKLSRENISILFISKDSKHFSLCLPLIAKNSDLKASQYRALEDRQGIAKSIVYQKISNHAESLKKYDFDLDIYPFVEEIKRCLNIEELLSIEGRFAKNYFDRYFSIFPKNITKGFRSKNPPLDIVNSLMSYIYTIFYHTITAKLYIAGFEPSISYLHTPFRSHYALSSDILEFFRSDINDFVASEFLNKHLTSEDFSKSSNGGIYLKFEARRELWKRLSLFMREKEKDLKVIIANFKKSIAKSIE